MTFPELLDELERAAADQEEASFNAHRYSKSDRIAIADRYTAARAAVLEAHERVRAEVIRAMRLLQADDGYDDAMRILHGLSGLPDSPQSQAWVRAVPVGVEQVAGRKNSAALAAGEPSK